MNKDQVEGKLKDVGGRIERQVGEWTGDPQKQGHGALKQAEGKVQNAWGNVKEAGKKAVDEVEKQHEAEKQEDSRQQPAEVEEETEVRTTRRKAS
jgi:uncharacterized protein YjbJ (UPF0337 family)